MLRDLAAKVGCTSRLIFVDVPVATARERWRLNRQTHERFDLPETLFESALTAFERPSPDERAIVYVQADDLDEWIRAHFSGH